MKKLVIFCGVTLLLVVLCLIIYPHIEIVLGNRLILCSYTDRLSEFDQNQTLDEVYCYNAKRDISIYSFSQHRFLFFHLMVMEFVPGDMRAVEFLLEEAYIDHFLQNAVIEHNAQDIDLACLIADREAVVGNTRYLGNDYENAIYYTLDGRHEVLYIFYIDDLLVIQVGYSDEGPKFIAYR